MDPFLGQIIMFGGNFAPRGWAFCDGQLLPIASYSALFSILGTIYGGDGRTTFALPDLRGRAPIHEGVGPGLETYRQGQRGGVEHVTLNITQIPSHTHLAAAKAASGVDADTPAGNTWSNGEVYSSGKPTETMDTGAISVLNAGGSQSHENRPPFLVVNYIIALQGVFPSRS